MLPTSSQWTILRPGITTTVGLGNHEVTYLSKSSRRTRLPRAVISDLQKMQITRGAIKAKFWLRTATDKALTTCQTRE